MDGGLGDEEEAALSDFEDDDLEAAPMVLPAAAGAPPAATPPLVNESLKAALAELEQERQARKAAEAAKADLDTAAVRLKSYIHEVIRQRDDALRQKDEALRGKEDRSKQLDEAIQLKEDLSRQKDELSSQRDEIQRQKDDMSRARDSAKAEIEGVARILVTQAEKIMSMTNGVKSFSGGLPRVPKSSGLAAIALGFAKRVEEVVDEVLRQREDALQRSNELRNQMEQRNFSIAIEVSQLEASITQMKEEVGKKSSELERWQKLAAGKDGRIAEIEQDMLEQVGKTKQEAEALRQRVDEVEALRQRVDELESRLNAVNSETAQNIECAAKVKTQLQDILGLLQSENSFSSFQSDLIANPQDEADETQQEENNFLAEGQEILDLTSRVAQLWKENQQKAERERKDFESTVKMLHAEKGDILQKLSFSDPRKASPEEGSEVGSTDDTEDNRTGSQDSDLADGKTSSQRDVAASEDSTERYQIIGEGPQQTSLKLLQSELAAHESLKEQTAVKIALLEQDVENLQKEGKRTVSSARQQIERLQQQLSAQGRDLAGASARISELEKHVESITGELVAAEEEVARWKEAATAEAAAGARVLEEVEIRNKEIAALNERSAKYRELVEEANVKVGSKEDMALAAIAALNAAERSRQIADERAADLRDRIEEMNRQLEELEQKGEHRGWGLCDWCVPWLRLRGRRGQDSQLSAEMEELLDPLV